ncbi:hypothetical protein H2198_000044 [Neophaeococcomyces mojaviensis]|uniref:Uncharacterized protein n=1 Tax=Neophaeococcomyces mojaviensis TaxID=3383035 RepID=A0ACC3ALI4_9EURO|nr:hypothetical protein H2198_000044 [Knufia sp. JES_112]
MAASNNPSPQSARLAQLRALAQDHLSNIEAEKTQEQAQLSQAEADIQRYSKMSSFDRKKLQSNTLLSPDSLQQASTTPDAEGARKKDRFRPFSDILHRLRWDPKLDINDYIVGYLERFEGVKEIPASSWIRDFSEEEWIPMHRVRYVKRVRKAGKEGEDEGPELGTVWDRDGRIDRIFGSGGSDGQDDLFSVEGTSVIGGVALQ